MLLKSALAAAVAGLLLVAPLAIEAQPPGKIPRIGFLSASISSGFEIDGFRQGLREYGYVEGQNLRIEWRFAEGRNDRLSGLAAELVRLKLDIIVTVSTTAALAAKKATEVIPIVFTIVSDPVGSGLVPSLARPGGNVTGISGIHVDLTGKRLELFKEAVPSLRAVVILTDPTNPANALIWKEARASARSLGLEIRLVEVRHPAELEPAFTAVQHERASGVVLAPSAFLVSQRIQIGELAGKGRIPVVGWQSELARSGALISYGPSNFDMGRRAVGHVAKILNGAKPADLPVEQPTKFELVINGRTAKALGLTIPQSLLLRADQVID